MQTIAVFQLREHSYMNYAAISKAFKMITFNENICFLVAFDLLVAEIYMFESVNRRTNARTAR